MSCFYLNLTDYFNPNSKNKFALRAMFDDDAIAMYSPERPLRKGDLVALSYNNIIVAIAKILSNSDIPEDKDWSKYENIAALDLPNKDKLHVAKAVVCRLLAEDWIGYQSNVNNCLITQEETVERIKTAYNKDLGYWVRRPKQYYTSAIGKAVQDKIKQSKELLKANHNLILTGAPGTGKTHLAKAISEDMDNTSKMVQFHPSFDYTDFVEGLRPVNQKGQIVFQRKDGFFKKFCKKALFYSELAGTFDKALQYFKKAIMKGDNGKDTIIKDYMKLQPAGWSTLENKLRVCNQNMIKAENGNKSFAYNDVSNLVAYIVYYIRKHYMREHQFVFIIDEINRGEIAKIFGELFYAMEPGYRGEKGRIKTQYQNLVPRDDPFAEGFYIPENVYIIGTMNDIDRSVESMDFALRRRFAFLEVSAEESQEILNSDMAWGRHKPEASVLAEIKARMNRLNAALIDKYEPGSAEPVRIGLTKDFQIGGAYFLKYALFAGEKGEDAVKSEGGEEGSTAAAQDSQAAERNAMNEAFEKLWKYHLQGLLKEYFRGQPDLQDKMAYLKSVYDHAENSNKG